ncbi:hypothetical protein [Rhodopirellula europaea]|nr:hypothetical protein [Rhodopirellula europaea]
MSRLTKWIAVPVLAVAATFMGDAPEANAQGFSLSIGTGGFSYGNYGPSRYSSRYGSRYGSYYNNGHRAFGPVVYPSRYSSGYRGYARPHYDYHGPTLVPHGNHYHYQPGHYDLHYGRHGRGHRGHH